MKILSDMNIPPRITGLLQENGLKAVHWSDVGSPGAKDEEILEFARLNDYVVLTCDLDFSTILAYTHGHKPSIVQLRLQVFPLVYTAKMIAHAVKDNIIELDEGAILSLDAKNSRVRLLPLKSSLDD